MTTGIGLGFLMPASEGPSISFDGPSSASPISLAPRGPRSLGIRGGFVAAPSSSLPRTLYTRDPATNPLIPLPLSPNLDIPLAEHSPSLHLRAMKKRSVANRNFGVNSDGGLEGFHGPGAGPVAVEAKDSPTIPASPSVPSSPFMSSPAETVETMDHSTHPFLATSIALSVILGLILLGMTSWAGIAYRRRRIRAREKSDQHHRKGYDFETFSASNIAEKGFQPRSSMACSATRPKSIIANGSVSDGRRVSFIDVPIHYESMMDIHDQFLGGDRDSVIARSRMRSSTLSAIERHLVSSRPPSAYTISTLDPIEEETTSIRSHSTVQSLPDLSQYEVENAGRPDSMASTATGSSAYTTASARSSISDLTSLSTISCLSAFPETPRSDTHTLPRTSDSPSKTSWDSPRRARAKSQTVVNVTQVDLLRTAVGRTMSLQPSKQVVKALQQMSAAENAHVVASLIRNDNELLFSPPSPDPDDGTYVERFRSQDPTEDGDIGLANGSHTSRPDNGMRMMLFSPDSKSPDSKPLVTGMDDETPGCSPVTRSRSFPSKLLSRRKSIGENVGTRRSEILSAGYLKRALRALRGVDDMPPSSVPGSLDFVHVKERRMSSESTMTEASASSRRHTLDDIPFSPDWEYAVDLPGFDAYYTDDQFGIGTASDDECEEAEDEGCLATPLPDIRITSH